MLFYFLYDLNIYRVIKRSFIENVNKHDKILANQ